MAVKKSKPAEAEVKQAPSKKPATKPTKSATPKSKGATPAVATTTASKAETPKPAAVAPKKAAAVAPKKAAAPVKLTDRQLEFLKQIMAKEEGYLLEKKAEQKTVDALLNRKLIKKAAKDKTSGHYRYIVSKAGEKHLSAIPPA